MKVKIGYIGYSWWDKETQEFHGDMGYAIDNESETRVLARNINDTIRSYNLEYIDSEDCVENGDYSDEGFAVYELTLADLDVDEEEIEQGDDINLTYGRTENDKIIEVFVCAPASIARKWVEEEYGKDVEAHYRDEDEVRLF